MTGDTDATARSPSPLTLGDPLITGVNWHQHQPPTSAPVPTSPTKSPGSSQPPDPDPGPGPRPRRLQCLLDSMPPPTDDETPFPSLDHSALHGFGRSHLSPDDAFVSPPRGPRGRSRRRKRPWKKLMWVKQSCTPQKIPVLDNGS